MTAPFFRPKVLIVDDLAANLVALRHLLAKVDVEVIAATSGNEALALTLNHDFALILLDVQMPDMDGYETAELMRGEERTREVPIIFITAAYKDDHHRRRGYGAGAVDYIEKPIDDVILLSKVRVFIELYRSHAEARHLLELLKGEIAERKRREEDSQLLAGTIFATSAEGIIVTDADNAIITVNPAFTRVTGYQPNEVVGRNPRLLASGRHDRNFYAALWTQVKETGQWQGEIWNRRKDGEIYPQWLSISVVRTIDGAIGKYVGIFSDITKRKRYELELTESRLAAELANSAKSRFLANMSHELRTPLNAIIGFAELIDIQLHGVDVVGKHLEYLRDIQASGRHLLDLVNDLLDMAKIEADKWTLNVGPVSAHQLVDESIRLLAADAKKGAVTLVVDPPAAFADFVADRRAIKQCLLNLLSNAIKFTPPGGEVRLSVTADDTHVTFCIADTGIGIPSHDIPRLLLPFEQGRPALARANQGAGLGLALVKSFVEMHGGRLDVTSRPGEGTIVTMAIPFAETRSG